MLHAWPCKSRLHLQKAKLHHPDVSHKRTDNRHFARILVAYQVLSNARQRQLYDLSLKSSSSPIHNAAQQGSRYCSYRQMCMIHLHSSTKSLSAGKMAMPPSKGKANGCQELAGLPGPPEPLKPQQLTRSTSYELNCDMSSMQLCSMHTWDPGTAGRSMHVSSFLGSSKPCDG